jgi:hypothetical protein
VYAAFGWIYYAFTMSFLLFGGMGVMPTLLSNMLADVCSAFEMVEGM